MASVARVNKSSAVAEMGDRSHNRHGPKRGGGPLCPFREELGLRLIQCGLCRDLLRYKLSVCDGVELSDIYVSEDIIRKKLMNIRMDKAPGVNELVPRFLAALSDEISIPLNIIYNRSLREGEVPKDWRDANVQLLEMAVEQYLVITDQLV